MTEAGASDSARAYERAVASSRWRPPALAAFALSSPFSEKSEPVAMAWPSTEETRAPKAWPADVNAVSIDQYWALTCAMRSRSRATTRRVATDCTRPADRDGRILRHRRGDTS